MSAQCQPIRDEIKILEDSLDDLDLEIKNESDPKIKAALIHFRKQTLSHLQRRKAALVICEAEAGAPPDSPPGFVVFGEEIQQGIPGYELVSGKNTLVRIFLGVKPPVVTLVADLIFEQQAKVEHTPNELAELNVPIDLPPWTSARLDYAELIVTDPRGNRFIVPGDIGDGLFTNIGQSYSADDNANFPIDGRLLTMMGQYEFLVRFYLNGQVVAERSLGRHVFHPSKDLRLLVVMEIWPFPADKWPTLINALGEVSRIFPVRTGVGALDADLTAGLRYVIDPEPINFQWPDKSPVRKRLSDFNKQQQQLGHPDRAEHVLTIRTQQPGEMPLGGNADSGPNGSYAGTVLNVNPPMDNVFGTLVSHELGHNFIPGIGHTENNEFVINEPSAFDVRLFADVSAPRSLMHGVYSNTPNGTAFLYPDQWRLIRNELLTTSSTGTG